jgi:hypothetical protein
MATDDAWNCSQSTIINPRINDSFSEGQISLCLSLVILCVALPLLAVLIFGFVKANVRNNRLRARKIQLIAPAVIACFCQAAVGPGQIVIGIANFPCWTRSLIMMFVVPFLLTNILLKLLAFSFLSSLSRNFAKIDNRMENEALHGNRLSCGVGGDILYTLYCIVFNKRNLLPVEKLVSALTFTVSNKGILTLICCLSLPFILVGSIVMATRNEFLYGCTGCELTLTEIAVIVIVSLVFLTFGIIFNVRTWHLPDPWRFRQEILLVIVGGLITLLGFVLNIYFYTAAEG